jgi:hypothetical protein
VPAELLIAALLLGLLIAVFLVYRARSASPGRTLWRDERGTLVAIGERGTLVAIGERGIPEASFSGQGNFLSKPLQLPAASYRIDYQFAASTRLALVDANGDETLFIKSGAGTESFTITSPERYRFLLEPAAETAAWQFSCRAIVTRTPPDA